MRFIGYDVNGSANVGRLMGDRVAPLTDVASFYRDLDHWLGIAASAEATLELSALSLKPAIPDTARVPCIGLNYKAHAEEAGLPFPPEPVVFGRYAQSLAASGADIPVIDERTDWEGELAIVIGKPLFRGDDEAAHDAILGFATFNDVSARTYQVESSQWTMGKNGEASGIVGEIVTRDEAGDPASGLALRTLVNGQVVQQTLTSDMIFSVERIVAYLSKAMRLMPGDIIPTGTPSGVGLVRTPPVFLKPGDTVEVSIERLGTISNRMVACL